MMAETTEQKKSNARAVRVYAFFTTGDGWLSRLIRPFSNPTHAGLMFMYDTAPCDYAESLFGEGFRAGKDVAGLHEWAYERAARTLIIEPLEIYDDAAEAVHQRALALHGVAGYNTWQLVQMLLFRRYGLPDRSSPSRMVCSEAQARLIYPHYDLRSEECPSFDSITPEQALARIRAIHKQHGKGGASCSDTFHPTQQQRDPEPRSATGLDGGLGGNMHTSAVRILSNAVERKRHGADCAERRLADLPPNSPERALLNAEVGLLRAEVARISKSVKLLADLDQAEGCEHDER